MRARPRTTSVRLTPGEARFLLAAVEVYLRDLEANGTPPQIPEAIDALRETVGAAIPTS